MNDFDRMREEMEKLPKIEYRDSGGNWNELIGHACETREQAEAYCKRFGGNVRMKPTVEEK